MVKININLDKNKPWLQQSKTLLYKLALKETNGDKQKAAQLLGCTTRTLRNEIKRNKELKEFYNPQGNTKSFTIESVLMLFNMELTISEIASKLNTYPQLIEKLLEKRLGDKFKEIQDRNKYLKTKGDRMFDVEKILENNRVILSEIAEKIRENKTDELSTEYLTYAKILYNNGFINSKGEITESGKDALYH